MNIKDQVKSEILDNYEYYYKLAFSYVLNKDDALDIVQESVYKAILKCDSIKKSDSISSWIYKIVMNTAMETLRKKSREPICRDEIQASFDNEIIEKASIFTALARLEEKDRAVLVLRYYQDKKIMEIAEILGENENTVKSRLYRALKKMKEELTPER